MEEIELEKYIKEITITYTEIFGKEYEEIIKEKLQNAKYITYNTDIGIKEYKFFLEHCKAKELALRFLKEIGIDTICMKNRNLTQEIPKKIKRYILEYIGGISGFTFKPEQNMIGIRAFDKKVQEDNKKEVKTIDENQIIFLNFLLKEQEEEFYSKEDVERFFKTTKGQETYTKIQNYIKIYNKLLEEYIIYSKKLEKYQTSLKNKKEELEEIISKIGDTKENRQVLEIILENPKIFVQIKNVENPILFYTIRQGGVLDYTMLHEFCHVIETNKENGKCVGSGFDITEELNPYRKDKRKYERLNENFTDIFSIQATRTLHKKGKYLLEPQELVIPNIMDYNTSGITKKMLIPFLQKYKKQIIEARIIGNIDKLLEIIGENNFEELNDCINKVDYLIEKKNLNKYIGKKEKNEVVKKYNEQLERLKTIYANMELYTSRTEEQR